MSSVRAIACLLLPVLVSACAAGAGSPVGRARYANQPPVAAVADRADTPRAPAVRPFARTRYYFDTAVYEPTLRVLRVEAPRRALDVNAFDEVPDSTWFENRIGARALSPADVARGPGDGGPDRSQRWRVVSSKATGAAAGFVIEDARRVRFLVKFDEPGFPQVETSSAIVTQRLLWAIGYHVPEDHVVTLRRDDVVLDDDAVVKDGFGRARPMTEADLDAIFARADRRPDGGYRALASRFLPGRPLGGFPAAGVRADDPNDTIPHQHRRSLRALQVVFGWVQQTDVKDDNTVDVWIERDGSRHVVHYLVDFGKSLGAMGLIVNHPGDGHVYRVDPGAALVGLSRFGLVDEPYTGVRRPALRGVGHFDAAHYDPARFRASAPWAPFAYVDDADRFWSARVIAALTPAHIRAAVDAAGYDDPRAAAYVARTLVERRRKLLAWAFRRVSPLADFTVRAAADGTARLCFVDLGLEHGVERAGRVSYQASVFDWDGLRVDTLAGARPDASGRACLAGVAPGPSHDGYAIVRIHAARGARRLPPVQVHAARDPTGSLRVIGIDRGSR